MRASRALMIVALVGLAVPSAQAGFYADAVLLDGPLGYWRLDGTEREGEAPAEPLGARRRNRDA